MGWEKRRMQISSQSFLNLLKEQNIPYQIAGSYGMRKFREPRDLDVLLKYKSDWDKLKKYGKHNQTSITIRCSDKDIELFWGWTHGITFDSAETELDEQGNPSWTLKQTVKWKKLMARPKDLADIALIRKK